MQLKDFGYNNTLEEFRIKNNLDSFEIGRVIAEHKERYIVKTAKDEFEAEITGNMRFAAKSRIDFPAVGSGHFLVSVLNELVALKNELRILQDENGNRLRGIKIENVNDELLIINE
ncbi:MAG: hypothetical protein JXR51_08025 [Bacteroidales bacterium]|nr:hypothetical protein [Bacteroidales bacterium]MBN2757108.1 hypothetical protein [Bacteroidales bacterium]